jgi:uncharacterized protein
VIAYLWMGVLAGLFASPHCAGMCGAFPLHLARAAGRGRPAARQLLYVAGKTLTYAFLGALAGAAGQALLHNRAAASAQTWLAYGVGALLVGAGLSMLGVLPRLRLRSQPASEWTPLRDLVGQLFHSPGPGAGFLLGVATGFLPCPITITLLLLVAASHSPLLGLVTMVGLGVGTAPALLGIGLSGALLDARLHRFGLRGAGALMVLLGVITALRPTGLFCQILPVLGPIGR